MATLKRKSKFSSIHFSKILTWAIAKNPASVNCEHRVASSFLKQTKTLNISFSLQLNITLIDENMFRVLLMYYPLNFYNLQWLMIQVKYNVQQ